MTVFDALTGPFEYAFMVRALIAVLIVGALNAVVGSFVVLRGMAFYGDALAHAILPGVAVGYLLGATERGSLFWWALAAAAVSTAIIGWIRHEVRLKEDAAIGITFSGMLALGVVLISSTGAYAIDLAHFLFGDIFGITSGALIRAGIFAALVIGTVILAWRKLLLISFDPQYARALRLPVKRIDTLLLALISVTVVVSLQTVGIALMTAMLVTPASTGYLFGKRVPQMMALGALAAAIGGIGGLYLSYYGNIAGGAAVVLCVTVLFGLMALVRVALYRRG